MFLSSTYKDLTEYRKVVEASFAISGIAYNAMEHFGSTPRPPIRTCLDAVEQSDVFVGVIGVRYGGSPPSRKLSYTEREYRHAKARGISRFMFLIDTRNANVAPELITGETEEQQKRLKQFRDLIENNYTVTYFKAPGDLSRLILASIIKEFGVLP